MSAPDGAEPAEIPTVTEAALDRLLHCWKQWDLHERFYLNELAADIAATGVPLRANDAEREAVTHLQALLGPRFVELPALLRVRRAAVAEQERLQVKRREELTRVALEAEELRRNALLVLPGETYELFERDFLAVDGWYETHPLARHMPPGWLQEQKVAFVRAWAARVLDERLDEEQALAVATTGHARVTARAGSGKTGTLVARTAFLVRHCGVPAHTLLLIAFNREAAAEMQTRLTGLLPDSAAQPHVMTFHALAYALIHPDEDLIGDAPDRPVQSALVQTVINRLLASRSGAAVVRQAMTAYFDAEWSAIAQKGLSSGRETYFQRVLASPFETFGGHWVKSYGERVIANTLFRLDLDYRYEWAFRWEEVAYRPDFTIMKNQTPHTVIEYLGLQGLPDYDEQADANGRSGGAGTSTCWN